MSTPSTPLLKHYSATLKKAFKGSSSSRSDYLVRSCGYHLNVSLPALRKASVGFDCDLGCIRTVALRYIHASPYSRSTAKHRQRVVNLALSENYSYQLSLLLIRLISIEALLNLLEEPTDGAPPASLNLLEATLAVLEHDAAKLCAFEHLLLLDPAGSYELMSEASKHVYRCEVEGIAEHAKASPTLVMTTVINLARPFAVAEGDELAAVKSHLGYWVIDDGRQELARNLKVDLGRFTNRMVSPALFALLTFLISLIAAMCIAALFRSQQAVWVLPLAFVLLEPVSKLLEIATSSLCGTRKPLQFDLSLKGIPENCFTIIAVPIVLHESFKLEPFLKRLERNFRITNDSNVMMVVLADFPDARSKLPTLSEEYALKKLVEHVRMLDDKYARENEHNFLCLYRDRRFSIEDNEWRGYERKRGKIHSLAAFILQKESELIGADGRSGDSLRKAKYMLCVDEDTLLTSHAVQMLIGTLEHPLNRALLRADKKGRPVIKRGHAAVAPVVLQNQDVVKGLRWPGFSSGQYGVADDLSVKTEYVSNHFNIFGNEPHRGKALVNIASYYELCGDVIPSGVVLSHDTVEGGMLLPSFSGKSRVIEGGCGDEGQQQVRALRWVRGDLQNFLLVLGLLRRRGVDLQPWCKLAIFVQVYSALLPVILFAWALLIVISKEVENSSGLFFFYGVMFLFLVRILTSYSIAIPETSLRRIIQLLLLALMRTVYAWSLVPLSGATTVRALFHTGVNIVYNRNLLSWVSSSSEKDLTEKREANLLLIKFISVVFGCALGLLIWLDALTSLRLFILLGWTLVWPLTLAAAARLQDADP